MSKKQKEQPILLESQTLPSENELEQSILGSIIVDNAVFAIISKDFSENLFYESKNKLIADAIIDLYKGNIPIDILTISQQLTKNNKITEAGGAYYISTLTNKALSSANIEYHLKILQQKSLERSLVYICNKSLVSVLTY
jgi:replicative DNA helicase